MSDQQIYFLIAILAYMLHTYGKLEQRPGTVKDWLRENRSYLFVSTIIQFAVILIGPGDGVEYGTNAARMFAFAGSVTMAEVIRMGFKIPEERRVRKAHAAEEKAETQAQ